MSMFLRSRLETSDLPLILKDRGEREMLGVSGQARLQMVGNKPPFGLWYQCGDGWERWCSGNQDDWLHPHRAVLAVDHTKVAVLRTPEEIGEFKRRFRPADTTDFNRFSIDWVEVAKHYDGVEMPFYEHHWSLGSNMNDCGWTCGWRCPSGVVWRAASNMKFLHIEDRTAGPPPGVVEKWTDAANTAVDMGFASLELRAISRLGESFSAMGVAAGEAAEAMRRFAEADVSAASQLSSLGI